MANFELRQYTNDSLVLRPFASRYTDEYLAEHEKYYLIDKLVREDDQINTYYQLHSCDYLSLNDTMAFDIPCPKCKRYLKVYNLGSDGHTHSWYHCPFCNHKR